MANCRAIPASVVARVVGVPGGMALGAAKTPEPAAGFYQAAQCISVRKFGRGDRRPGEGPGVVAALAAAPQGANTALIGSKGYTGVTVTEGGTALTASSTCGSRFPASKNPPGCPRHPRR